MEPLPSQFIPLGFDFNNYPTIEKRMIKPLLERAGFVEVRFNPLVEQSLPGVTSRCRMVEAQDAKGNKIHYWYG